MSLDKEEIADELDALAAAPDEQEETPELESEPPVKEDEALAADPDKPADTPDPLIEAIQGDPELSAKLEYAHKLSELGKKDAAQKLYDEINVAIGVAEEPEKAPEPPPFLAKVAADDDFNQEIVWQNEVAKIDDLEADIESFKSNVSQEYATIVDGLNEAAGRILEQDELRKIPAVQAVVIKWNEAAAAKRKADSDRAFVQKVERLVGSDPDLKRIRGAYLQTAAMNRQMIRAPKDQQLKYLAQLGVYKPAASKIRPKLKPEAIAAMRAKNTPKIGAQKGDSAGSAPSKAKIVPMSDAMKTYAALGGKFAKAS